MSKSQNIASCTKVGKNDSPVAKGRVRGHGRAARVVIGARVRCTERRESHKHKRSRQATDGWRAARRGTSLRAHPAPRAPPSAAPLPLPLPCPDARRQPAALSRRAARRFLSPHAVASFSPLPHFRPPRSPLIMLNFYRSMCFT